MKRLPSPTLLLTNILQLCFSTISLQSSKPIPVPASLLVPGEDVFWSILKRVEIFSALIPTPLSAIVKINLSSSVFSEYKFTDPPDLVNLIAFEIKF